MSVLDRLVSNENKSDTRLPELYKEYYISPIPDINLTCPIPL